MTELGTSATKFFFSNYVPGVINGRNPRTTFLHRLIWRKHEKIFLSLTTGWILTKLGRNDPYMVLSKNGSNGFSL